MVHVPARQYPVTLHFARRTELRDYVGAAFKKVPQIVSWTCHCSFLSDFCTEHAASALQATVLPQTVLTLLHRTWHRTQVRQIHRRLPPGGVLVFVTGQREVEHLVARLRAALAPAAASTAAPHAASSDRPPTPAEEVRAAAPGGPCPSTA